MTATIVTYSDAQIATLRLLARAHGHGWACEADMPTAHPITGARMSQSMIMECYTAIAQRERWEPWQRGIAAPEAPSYSGAVCHTTGTGRVSWQVHDDGGAGIVICRPGEEYTDDRGTHRRSRVVLSAHVSAPAGDDERAVEIRTPDTRDHRIPDVHTALWSEEGGPRAESRHGDALLYALTALVGERAAREAIERAGVQVSQPAAGPDDVVIGGRGNGPVVLHGMLGARARDTLSALADRAAERMQPTARGTATAATLRQIAEIAGDLPLAADDACHGYHALGQRRESDDATTTSRRATCRELAAELELDATGRDGDISRLAAVMDAVVVSLGASDDPRHRAMVATARREAAELRSVIA